MKKLERLLKNASANVPYYIEYFSQKSNLDVLSLSSYPVIEKRDVMMTPERFINSMSNKDIKEYKTSGSTGVPLTFYKSNTDKYMQLKYLWKFRMNHYGIKPSANRLKFHFFSKDELKLNDIVITQNTLSINAITMDENILLKNKHIICDFKPKYIMGTPSIVCRFLTLCQSINIHILQSVEYVELMGEYLYDSQEKYIKSVLNCAISNHYGCTEVYGIAQRCEYGHMHIFTENVILEQYQKDNVLVTGLNNIYMPFIRYNLGDRIHLLDINCPCGETSKCIEILAGRDNEYVTLPNGNKKTAAVFYYIVEKLNRFKTIVFAFKVIQYTRTSLDIYLTLIDKNMKNLAKKTFNDELLKNNMESFELNFHFLDFDEMPVTKKQLYFENKLEV